MTVIELVEQETTTAEDAALPGRTRPSHTELLLDFPNVQAHVVELNGGRRSDATRLNLNALARHLGACDSDTVAGTFFMRIDTGDQMLPLVTAIRQRGFDVFARPAADIDDNIVEHLCDRRDTLGHVWLATHDRALLERCLAVLDADVEVIVLGLSEASSAAVRDDRVRFVDLGDIPNLLSPDLPRTTLETLPSHGRRLPALTRIRRQRA